MAAAACFAKSVCAPKPTSSSPWNSDNFIFTWRTHRARVGLDDGTKSATGIAVNGRQPDAGMPAGMSNRKAMVKKQLAFAVTHPTHMKKCFDEVQTARRALSLVPAARPRRLLLSALVWNGRRRACSRRDGG